MNQQDYSGYIHSTSEQAQSHGQVQSGSERAQSHGQVQFGSEQVHLEVRKLNLVLLAWRSKC